MNDRECFIEISIGKKGVGKTFTTKLTMNDYITTYRQPAIVFDVNNEYTECKAIDYDVTEKSEAKRIQILKDITVAKAYRIIPFTKDRMPMSTKEMTLVTDDIIRHFKGGLVIFDDINKYVQSNVREQMVGLLIGLRHTGNDLIVYYQSFYAVPPKFWANINILRLHKVTDNPRPYANKIANYELVCLMYAIVELGFRKGDYRYKVYGDIADGKFYIDEATFVTACKEYLNKNPKEIHSMTNYVDDNGKKMFGNRAEAINHWINERKYYLNL